jgi:hypothetical protein
VRWMSLGGKAGPQGPQGPHLDPWGDSLARIPTPVTPHTLSLSLTRSGLSTRIDNPMSMTSATSSNNPSATRCDNVYSHTSTTGPGSSSWRDIP